VYYERLTASFVLRYINRYLSTPVDQVPKELLEEYSYRRCAAYEIMDRIKRNPEKDGQLIVENYIREMFLYKNKDVFGNKENWEYGRRFEVAQELAEDILVWFIINGKEKKDA